MAALRGSPRLFVIKCDAGFRSLGDAVSQAEDAAFYLFAESFCFLNHE